MAEKGQNICGSNSNAARIPLFFDTGLNTKQISHLNISSISEDIFPCFKVISHCGADLWLNCIGIKQNALILASIMYVLSFLNTQIFLLRKIHKFLFLATPIHCLEKSIKNGKNNKFSAISTTYCWKENRFTLLGSPLQGSNHIWHYLNFNIFPNSTKYWHVKQHYCMNKV